MTPTLAEFELSMRRAPKRREVLLMLSSLSEATPLALARACGIDARRLRWIMAGGMPYYRPELALVPLGLVDEIQTPNGRVYRITERGRRKARQLAARQVRRAIARRAVREHQRTPEAAPARHDPALAAAASSSSWSWGWRVT